MSAKVQNVALVGSSGGGTATLATDPDELLRTLHEELGRIRARTSYQLKYALFLSLSGGRGLDSADPQRQWATLYSLGMTKSMEADAAMDDVKIHQHVAGACDDGEAEQEDRDAKQEASPSSSSVKRKPVLVSRNESNPIQVIPIKSGPLSEVNKLYRQLDEVIIAKAIADGDVGGLISISSDPLGINVASFKSASEKGIPVTGSGGTSLAAASAQYGVKLAGNAGGSVATSVYTKAVSFVHALASVWGVHYSPFVPSQNGQYCTPKARPQMKSVLEACLPAFITVCVICRALDSFIIESSEGVMEADASKLVLPNGCNETLSWQVNLIWLLREQALPIVCCIVSGSSYAPKHGSTVLMAAALAGTACGGSVVSGLIAGWIVAFMVSRCLFFCIRVGIPATMTNILVAGGVGGVVALVLSASRLVGFISSLTNIFRKIIRAELPVLGKWSGQGMGFLFGCTFCHGSKTGKYHSIFLPVILIEMERGEPSLWGSIDECTLVLVSAGICAANIILKSKRSTSGGIIISDISSRQQADTEISLRGLLTNVFCGDFIEVAYPFMEQSWIVNASAYLGSGVATELLYTDKPSDVLSSAYLPVFVSLWLAKNVKRLSNAYLVAFGIPFLGTMIANALSWIRGNGDCSVDAAEVKKNQ
mmetsp:Transcript_7958/g.11797  ORF Transcript_7958/g.11797 Transcript_7958/m.11797 type:complete len:651 (-) Transcript_7958:1508-3460(-)|eukprot:CAMPEP_0196815378 /NCGR_PEP_ID=MMETSP1362-20130617/49381_1 /TAXON_ID=163516 /ORGANISM="Leptocylindrus danicus, Strain CCMP1856" /LENGTH=650 /DNA_ID=CAMNT_0042192305 /DNA_START=91 /DNA_END=2043 /DNA_ORIENTATION=+